MAIDSHLQLVVWSVISKKHTDSLNVYCCPNGPIAFNGI